MENASKALIIAGAILLSILIISLGIMVYNNAKNTVGSASLDKQEIQTFNSDWEKYVGDNKTASEVRTMISEVIASNASETNGGKGRTINIYTGSVSINTSTGLKEIKKSTTEIISIPSTLASNVSYMISVNTDSNTGLINEIVYGPNPKASGTQQQQ